MSIGIIAIIVFIIVLLAVHSSTSRNKGNGKCKYICTVCGSETNGKKICKGSFFIEIILWCCFIVPGALYTVWRLTTTSKVCHSCNGHPIIPINSPAARKLAASFSPDTTSKTSVI